MSIMHRYLVCALLKQAAFLVCVFACLLGLMQLMHDFHQINASYTLISAVYVMCLQLPDTVYAFTPVIGMLSIVMGVAELARHQEWLMCQVLGMRPMRMGCAIGVASAIFIVGVTGMGEGIGPVGNRKAFTVKNARLPLVLKKRVLVLPEGVWLKQGQEWVHLKAAGQDGQLAAMVRYRFDKTGALSALHYAASGHIKAGQLMAYQGWSSDFIRHANHDTPRGEPLRHTREHYTRKRNTVPVIAVRVSHYDHAQWPVHFTARLLPLLRRDLRTQSLWTLWHNLRYRQASQLTDRETELVYWRRLVQPLNTWLMMCWVGSLLCTTPLSLRQANQWRWVGVIVSGMGLYVVQQISGMVSMALSWPGAYGALFPLGFFATLLVLRGGIACLFNAARLRSSGT